jgi:MFS family permease
MANSNGTGNGGNKVVFIGCFIALVTTSFAFFSRMYLCDERFGTDFGIEKGTVGALKGAGVWPFAISIILFSLIIDRIGYRVAMFFSFVCYAIYMGLAVLAYNEIQNVPADQLAAARARGYKLLYWGSVILGLGNGTVEAFINPVVATIFNKAKTKWLNILHAGWPGGLVLGGVITILMSDYAKTGDWRIVIGIIAVPAVIYLLLLTFAKFPLSEREQAGVSYRQMLAELGVFGALIGFGLISMQLAEVIVPEVSPASADIKSAETALKDVPTGDAGRAAAEAKVADANAQLTQHKWIFTGALTGICVAVFAVYTLSLGRAIMAFLIIIMMPLAVTEIGTDGWITGLMKDPMETAGYDAGWVLVYTSAIMMVLRFFAGPIVHSLSPIGLLIISSIFAIVGLFALSKCGDAKLFAILAAATLYGIGKTFFWPTMLGVTAEQSPKGGALTLNAISGIGMIAVGVLGFPLIGALQEQTASAELRTTNPTAAQTVLVEKKVFGQPYQAIDPEKSAAVKEEAGKTAIAAANKNSQFDALAKMALFPTFMLVCYVILFLYFKSKGGYRAKDITHH